MTPEADRAVPVSPGVVVRPRTARALRPARLAVDGGEPLVPKNAVMVSRWPIIEPEDIERMVEQLRSGALTEMTAGTLVHDFERKVARLAATRYALTTSSGTSALHCALAAVGVEPGSEVVIPALGYLGCAAAVLQQHGIPTFADVDPHSFGVTAATVEEAITPETRAIMVVHMHGLPAPMHELRRLADARGVAIVEDFSHAAGAAYAGRPVGGLGTVGAASLMAGKNLPSAGEGGVLVTNDRDVRNRAARLKAFGEELCADGSYALITDTLGWNYRSNPVSLALAARQLDRLHAYNDMRRASASILDEAVMQVPGLHPPRADVRARHVYHVYRFRIDPVEGELGVTVDQAREGLKQVFWAEGLPLVEYQNVPLPGHPLVQSKIGHGRGCPWSCNGRLDISYDFHSYPGALDAIRSSLVVGFPMHAVLCNTELVENYVRCFEKVRRNLQRFTHFARTLPAGPPWAEVARLV